LAFFTSLQKVLKFKYWKWAHILPLKIWSSSYEPKEKLTTKTQKKKGSNDIWIDYAAFENVFTRVKTFPSKDFKQSLFVGTICS